MSVSLVFNPTGTHLCAKAVRSAGMVIGGCAGAGYIVNSAGAGEGEGSGEVGGIEGLPRPREEFWNKRFY